MVKHLRPLLAAFTVLPASVLVGMSLAFTGASLDTMRNTVKTGSSKLSLPTDSDLYVFHDTSTTPTIYSAFMALGAMLGALIAYPICDRVGRRWALFLTSPLYFAAYLIIATNSNSGALIFGRVLSGIGAGFTSAAVPVFIAEIANTEIRGILGSFHQLGIAMGAAIMYLMNDLVRTSANGWYTDNPTESAPSDGFTDWRYIAYYSLIVTGPVAGFIFFHPETPRWLASKGKVTEAKASLTYYREGRETEEEIRSLESIIGAGQNQKSPITWQLIKDNRLQLFVGIGLHALQMLAGIQAFNFYLSTILQAAEVSNKSTVSLISMILKFACNSFVFVAVDIVGRKLPLMISGLGMGLACLLFGIGFYELFEKGSDNGWIFQAAPYLYCISYAMGAGAIPWLLMPEIFRVQIRAFASSLASFVNWSLCFVIVLSFKSMTDSSLNYQGTIWFYGFFGFVMFFFTWYFLPETKGKTFEEIKAIFDQRMGVKQKAVAVAEEERQGINNTSQ
jgi:sugar porter (SP) family MFS transporter